MNIDKIPEKYQEDIQKAQKFLKNEGCESVFLFGSIVTGKIRENSDIDIGIKGLPPEKFFKVYSKLYMDLTHEFHLVDFDSDINFLKYKFIKKLFRGSYYTLLAFWFFDCFIPVIYIYYLEKNLFYGI